MKRAFVSHGIAVLVGLLTLACSKNNDTPGNGNGTTGLKGKLLYTFAGTVSELDLSSNDERVFFTYNTYGFNSWHMSRDYRYRLVSEREPGMYNGVKFTLVNNANGIIADEYDYIGPSASETGVGGQLSPDNTMALISPTLNDGIVITDLDGNHLHHFEGINVNGTTIEIGLGDEALWLPDNGILFTLGERYILRSSPPYTEVSLLREMPYTQWGNLRINNTGTQLCLQIDLHIYVMDLDGGDPVQVTNSKGVELSAAFSPDGRHLVVGKRLGDVTYFNLAIVPNDGKVYDMDNDPAVIIVQPNGDNIPAAVNGQYFWTPSP
ncbi:TolB family protein [Parapedobacter soli]|uniref:TolB family protein n=1 Tax=Parapedobacter soli TaxID=416955 RepID=UPI0021C9722B|nr:hypothetical protein [Parapedobacter soli]